MTSNAKQQALLERECAKFNAEIKLGDAVAYQEVMREGYPVQIYTTRTDATILSGHAVVWLNGKSGCVLISHCRKATPEEAFEAVEAIRRADALARIKDREAEARREALRQLDAAPYFITPAALALLPRDVPVNERKAMVYSSPLVDALVQSVEDLLRVATRLDVPKDEQIEIAERASGLLKKFRDDEPCPF